MSLAEPIITLASFLVCMIAKERRQQLMGTNKWVKIASNIVVFALN